MSGVKPPKRVLVVDGYNVINARRQVDGAQALADARDALLRELQNYAGFSGQKIILVFDAWMSDRNVRTVEKEGNVTVVYTQKGETADHYIERFCDDHAQDVEYRRIELRVATSDLLEQTIVLGRGATRISSRELLLEMRQTVGAHPSVKEPVRRKTTIGDSLPPAVLEKLKQLTLSAKEKP